MASTLIALHAAIALCGPGLHAAPGLGHAGAARASLQRDSSPEFADVSPDPTEHCPVCDYFAQGQLPLVPAAPVGSRFVASFEPNLAHPPIPLPPSRSNRSRAPPRIDSRTA